MRNILVFFEKSYILATPGWLQSRSDSKKRACIRALQENEVGVVDNVT